MKINMVCWIVSLMLSVFSLIMGNVFLAFIHAVAGLLNAFWVNEEWFK